MRSYLALTALAVGCHPRPAPTPALPAPPASSTPSLPRAVPCVPPPPEGAAVTRASGDSDGVRFCFGDGGDACYALRFDGMTAQQIAPPAPPAGPRAEVAAGKASICADGACRPLPVEGGALAAAVDATGERAAVLVGDGVPARSRAEIWEPAAGARRASFPFVRGDHACGRVALLGATVYVDATVCGAPSGRGTLYTLAGKRLADVGGKDFGTFGDAVVQVEGALWAFLEERGGRIAVQDVAKGTVLRTLDVAALWPGAAAGGAPGQSALVRLDAGKLAVIAGPPRLGGIALVDVEGGPPTILEYPRCPAGS